MKDEPCLNFKIWMVFPGGDISWLDPQTKHIDCGTPDLN